MNQFFSEKSQQIKSTVEICEKANDYYLQFMKQYVKRLMFQDKRNDVYHKIGTTVIKKSIMDFFKMDTRYLEQELRSLKPPDLLLISTNLETINKVIAEILTKYGWPKPKSKKSLKLGKEVK